MQPLNERLHLIRSFVLSKIYEEIKQLPFDIKSNLIELVAIKFVIKVQ